MGTFGIVKDQSDLVYHNMHQIKNLAREKKGKKNLVSQVVCIQMFELETSAEVSIEVNSSPRCNSELHLGEEFTSLTKTTLLQMEPFLTMFFTINILPMLVTILYNLFLVITNSVQCL